MLTSVSLPVPSEQTQRAETGGKQWERGRNWRDRKGDIIDQNLIGATWHNKTKSNNRVRNKNARFVELVCYIKKLPVRACYKHRGKNKGLVCGLLLKFHYP